MFVAGTSIAEHIGEFIQLLSTRLHWRAKGTAGDSVMMKFCVNSLSSMVDMVFVVICRLVYQIILV